MSVAPDRPLSPSAPTFGAGRAGVVLGVIGCGGLAATLVAMVGSAQPALLADTFQGLVTVFLGIVVEALPFLLLGVLVSAAIQAFVPESAVRRILPRGRLAGTLAGALLGIALPVCECGVVPVARRLLDKGAPVPTAMAFLLAGSVVNPIVLVSTWIAFGDWRMAVARVLVVLTIACGVALLFSFHPAPRTLVVPSAPDAGCCSPGDARRVGTLLVRAGDELFEMGKYLVFGAFAAAALRTLVPGATLTELGQGSVVSVALMMGLAALLSICSVVDAFVALSFVGTFSSGALLAFLVFGPMVDIKSALMFLTIFRPRTMLLMVLLVAQLSFLVGVFVNLNVG